MEIYNESDITLLNDNINDIVDKVNKIRGKTFEPFVEEIKQITEIIINYVKEKGRKIYGGYALNLLIKNKNSDDAIYSEDATPDVDFYSPEPIKDYITLANELYKKKFKNVMVKEAQHKETYSLFVNQHLYCDLTYVPKNIYNRMPFIKINGLKVIGPYFMMIDYFRMLTDPLLSFPFRFKDKPSFKRFYLLQKYYPLPKTNKPIRNANIVNDINIVKNIQNVIYNFIKNRSTIINIGHYAYNRFCLETKNKPIEIPFFEIISTNYISDASLLMDSFKEMDKEISNDIYISEYFPFFQFFGYSVRFYYKDTLLIKIYNYNKKCLPYIDVKFGSFGENNKFIKDSSSFVRIGTFALTMLYILINIIKYRVDKNKYMMDLYFEMASHLVSIRNNYLKENNKTMLDDSIFKDFIIDCVGETETPERERKKLIEKRKKQGKKYVFDYRPDNILRDPESVNYIFSNSSGNMINNKKNKKFDF